MGFPINVEDFLKISYTTDCGNTEFELFNEGGDNLATQDPSFLDFTPDPTEWRTYKFFISDMDFDNIQLLFDLTSFGGSNVFLDNISVKPIGDVSADFEADKFESCIGTVINLKDETTVLAGAISSYKWNLPNATFVNGTSATDSEIQVTYATEGSFDAELIVEATSGDRDTITVSNYISIIEFVGNNHDLNQDFEGFNATDGLPLEGWELRGDPRGWIKSDSSLGAYGESDYSIVSPNYDFNMAGRKLVLRSPIVERLPSTKHIELSFDLAFAPVNFFGISADSLEIRYTTDCRDNFTTLFRESGFEFATAPIQRRFEPTNEEWENKTFYISNADFSQVQYEFVVTSEFANQLYIDNIKTRAVGDVVAKFELGQNNYLPRFEREFAFYFRDSCRNGYQLRVGQSTERLSRTELPPAIRPFQFPSPMQELTM